MAIIYHLVK